MLPLSHVCTLGHSLLSSTEAILDRWSVLSGLPGEGCDEAPKEEQTLDVPLVPRPLCGGPALRTFTVWLTQTAAVQVTVLGLQESCTAALRRLGCRGPLLSPPAPGGSSDLVRQLKRLWPAQFVEGPCPVVASAARLALQGCERLIGDTATERLLEVVSRLIGRLLGALVGGCAEVGLQTKEPHLDVQLLEDPRPAAHAPVEEEDVPEAAEREEDPPARVLAVELLSRRGRGAPTERFELVVKNSFIEVAEEPPSALAVRRTRSCGEMLATSTQEMFTLVVDCMPPRSPCEARRSQDRCAAAAEPQAEAEAELRPPAALLTAAGATPASGSRAPSQAAQRSGVGRSTVCLKGIPTAFTTHSLLGLLDARGFAGHYTFAYAPVDFARGGGLGYAIVCLDCEENAEHFVHALDGFSQWDVECDSVCSASWNEPHQGLDVLIERYRNSPVMHPNVAEAHRPVVFEAGRRVPFPGPTRPLRAPRVRHLKVPEAGLGA